MELTERFFATRSDRIIALARLTLAAFVVCAVWLDPSQPTRVPAVTYATLGGYLGFAAATAVGLQQRSDWSSRLALVGHLVDMSVFTFLVYSTEGPTSPFFLLFTFSMISATFRWRWRGALWTSLAVLALLLGSALVSAQLAPAMAFETDRFLIRCAHIMVVGAMLVYFGFHQQRMADEMTRLGSWPVDPLTATEPRALLAACTAHAAEVFGARRVLLALGDPEEPWATAGHWENGTFRPERLGADQFADLAPEALRDTSFLGEAGAHELLRLAPKGDVRPGPGAPVLTTLARDFGFDQVLSAPVHSERGTGRLFIGGRAELSVEDLMLASLVAGQIGAALDRMQAVEAMRRSTAAEERLHLARDLHDGVLQTLSGTALHLENLVRLAETEPAAVAARVRGLQDWLVGEQRELRHLIRRLRPGGSAGPRILDSGSQLSALVENLQRQWGITITLSGAGEALRIPAELEFHLHQIIREAAANAARHGGATELAVALTRGGDGLRLTIADNGRGLDPQGTFDAGTAAGADIGPRSLRERIAGLGGSLVLDSRAAGVTLDIRLPVAEPGASR